MAISQNFPSTRPSLNLNFARSKKLDPRITFTRTSSATYTDENGLIKTAPANEARFDHDPITGECLGLLIEEQRTNLWNNSNDFTVWTKQTSGAGSVGIAVTNATLSPDGTSNSYRYFAQESGSTFYSIYRGVAGISSNTTYIYSAFMKAGEISSPSLVVFDASPGSASFVNFNISNGTINNIFSNATTTISTASTITNYGNGWYNCSVVWSSTASGNGFQFKIDLGGALSQNRGMFVYGAQLEQGSFPTSYIPTTASTASRTADNASITGKNFSEWYRQDEGSIHSIISLTRQMTTAGSGTWTLDNGNFARGISLLHTSSPNVRVAIRDAVINQSSGDVSSIDLIKLKSCTNILKSATSESISCHNGSFTTLATYSLDVDISRLLIGLNNIIGTPSTNYLNGTISQLTYYPSRLTNTQIQTLTK